MQIEIFFTSLSLQEGVNKPSEIQLISSLSVAYIIFPATDDAKKLLFKLAGRATITGYSMNVDFYQMNLMKPKASAVDENLLQDWICDKVQTCKSVQL